MSAVQGSARAFAPAQVAALIVKLMEQKGEPMVKEVERRAADGKVLVLRGTQVGPDVLREALRLYRKANGTAVSNDAVLAKPSPTPVAVPTPSMMVSSQRWTPTASAAALASKALLECETAEGFCATVLVAGSNKVAVLSKPNVLSKPTGEYLQEASSAEVIARAMPPRDGRVYLRLRDMDGWVSTRSRKDISKVVLSAPPNRPALEPSYCGASVPSRAAQLLQHLDSDGKVQDGNSESLKEPKRFRAIIGCNILSCPDLVGSQQLGARVNTRDEFMCDGVFFQPADGRAYLRLADGRGWLCERSRSDFVRFIIEPCGNQGLYGLDDGDLEVVSAAGVATSLMRQRLDGSRKAVVVQRNDISLQATAALLPRQKAERPKPVSADPVVFRSDLEIWPEALRPPRPLTSGMRRKLRHLYGFYGVKVKQCEEDVLELTTRVATYGRACAAKSDLQQYADTLKKEVSKVQREWSKEVEDALAAASGKDVVSSSESKAPGMRPNTRSGRTTSSVAPVQVCGKRMYCAMLRSAFITDREVKPSADDDHQGPSRHLGPLRPTNGAAQDDLARMLDLGPSQACGEAIPSAKRRRGQAGESGISAEKAAEAGG